ncbi:MAG: hypothetical protein JXN10_11960 [Clostridia bacterium]|nr:hypothetical protein [Clostridia bacterium]
MDILSLLIIFFLIATVIKIATDNVAAVLKPIRNVTKYKLIIALILTAFGVFGLNMGVLEALNVPLEVSRSWFHYFDLVLTTLFLTGGAQAIHKLSNAWNNYKKIKAGDQ